MISFYNLYTGKSLSTNQSIFPKFTYLNGLVIGIFLIVLIVVAYYVFVPYISDKNYITNNEIRNENNGASGSEGQKYATIKIYYADWCPHCKSAMNGGEWSKFESDFNGTSVNGYILTTEKVDCSDSDKGDVRAIIDSKNIEGFPTIRLEYGNKEAEYDARPDAAHLEQFVNEYLQ